MWRSSGHLVWELRQLLAAEVGGGGAATSTRAEAAECSAAAAASLPPQRAPDVEHTAAALHIIAMAAFKSLVTSRTPQ